jgi:hypothetical protein
MGLVDTWIVYRFIRMLTTPWDETGAFKLGIIDEHGNLLKKVKDLTPAEAKEYTLFHRLVYNLKRLIELIPGGKSKIGTYAAALYLLKEQMGDTEGIIVLGKSFMSFLKENRALEDNYLEESVLHEEVLPRGHYKLINHMLDVQGDELKKGTIVVATTNQKPVAKVLGVEVYKLQVANHSNQIVVVSHEDIQEV